LILICGAGASKRTAPIDKLLLPINGKPLIRYVADNILKLEIQTVVVLPKSPHPRWTALQGAQLSKVSYIDSCEGLSGTLRAAVANLPKNVTHLCVVLADLPEIQPKDFNNIFDQVKAHPDAVIWRPLGPKGQPAHPIVFHYSTFKAFAKISGDAGAKGVMKKFRSQVHYFKNLTDAGSKDIDSINEYHHFIEQLDVLKK